MSVTRSLFAALVLCTACGAARAQADSSLDAPYVPTPGVVVDAMLKAAGVGPSDYVIDLGSGDGRIVIAAAKQYGARGFGVDLDGGLVNTARREAERQGVADRAEFFQRNLFVTDIGRATVLTMYLFPRIMLEVRARIFAEMKPGARVVSHEFDLGNWQPDRRLTIDVSGKPYGPPRSDVLLWIVPANASGRWTWQLAAGDRSVAVEATLDQVYQMLEGRATAGGSEAHIVEARVRGEDVGIAMVIDVNGRRVRHEFTGRMRGDTITGNVKIDGVGAPGDWSARRIARGRFETNAAASRHGYYASY